MSHHHKSRKDIGHLKWTLKKEFHEGPEVINPNVSAEITEKFWSNHLKLTGQDGEEITAFIPSGLEAK
jgi:hypothetical protein